MESLFRAGLTTELLCAALLLFVTVTSAEEGAQEKNSQCHNYAGGHVYPGEAFRVPVSDHSLHLSKAKSEFPLMISYGGDQVSFAHMIFARICVFYFSPADRQTHR